MNYTESIDWLFSLHRFGMKLGLDNIAALADSLGRPQDRFDSILIGGTNGKGSTAAMLHSILVASGVRSGLYTSPHLVRTEERIRLGEHDIAPQDLGRILNEVRSAIEALLAEERIGAHPTFFEVITATALVVFARAGVEVAVLEVGLGGRLDATNIVSPVLSIITNVDLDHQQQLGSSVVSIAREKAGILRAGITALIGEMHVEASTAIREDAAAIGAPVVLATDGSRIDARGGAFSPRSMRTGSATEEREARARPTRGTRSRKVDSSPDLGASTLRVNEFSVTTPVREYPRIQSPLPGDHQRTNALVAIRAAEILGGARSVNASVIERGIAGVRWAGRLEWIEGRPPLLLDGAHNPAACRSLAEYLETLPGRPVLLFAAMRDKEAGGMLEALLPQVSSAVFTQPQVERASDPTTLLEIARKVSGGGRASLREAGRDLPPVANRESFPEVGLESPLGAARSELDPESEDRLYLAEQDAGTALGMARRIAGDRGTVLVAGSLFLVGEIKQLLQSLPAHAGGRT